MQLNPRVYCPDSLVVIGSPSQRALYHLFSLLRGSEILMFKVNDVFVSIRLVHNNIISHRRLALALSGLNHANPRPRPRLLTQLTPLRIPSSAEYILFFLSRSTSSLTPGRMTRRHWSRPSVPSRSLAQGDVVDKGWRTYHFKRS